MLALSSSRALPPELVRRLQLTSKSQSVEAWLGPDIAVSMGQW